MTNDNKKISLRDHPSIIKILLKDRTTNKNIVWGTNNYKQYHHDMKPSSEIDNNWIINNNHKVIQPRLKKELEIQRERTKEKGEVFTPTWIVELKNNLIEEDIKELCLVDYINIKWLEITCGEAPYICTRYDVSTGNPLLIEERVGFLDRKLQRISKEVNDKNTWMEYVIKAYQSSYGYEYQGDSLFIARENLLYTFIDYYLEKFNVMPLTDEMESIARIISFNIFQMDGLTYKVPYTEEILVKKRDIQLNLFDDIQQKEEQVALELRKPNSGKDVKIKNWQTNKIIKFIDIQLEGKIKMKFDVVIGNPPYQENNNDRNRDDAIYPYFYDEAKILGEKYILISPARFLFGVGSTPKQWNEKMLKDEHLKVVYYNQDSAEVFNNTDIKGGIAILYRDSTKCFDPIGTFTPYKTFNQIIKKVDALQKNSDIEFGDLMYVQTKFNSTNLYQDYPKYKKILGSNGKEKRLTSSIFNTAEEIFTDEKQNENDVQIYGRLNNMRTYKWVNRKYLELDGNFKNYKVFIPAANGSGKLGETLSDPVIGKPYCGHTQTFISVGNFKTEFEAKSLLKYLKTKFARIMLGAKKTTHNNKTKDTWSKVPIIDFSPNSDIDWSKDINEIDVQLFKKYNLSEKEITFILKHGKEMK